MGTQGWQTEASEPTMPPPPGLGQSLAGTESLGAGQALRGPDAEWGKSPCTALWALHLWETQSWSRGWTASLTSGDSACLLPSLQRTNMSQRSDRVAAAEQDPLP